MIATLKRFGAGPILAADFVSSRRELALAMGADVVIDPAAVSPYRAWRDMAAGSAAQSVGIGEVPAALDAARDANGPARIIVVP